MYIYVSNIPFNASNEDLEGLFSAYGEVSSARIIVDKVSRRSRGFGFVEIDNDDDAKAAIEALNGKEFMGREIVVNEARTRE
ncbi:MAG: RNA recognition motif domain-containing protein [Bacteroidales bacterium]